LNRIICILLFIVISLSNQASLIEVGSGRTFVTITEALSHAHDNDTVLIHPGTYREGTLEINKPLVLMGYNDPILDGENQYEIIQVRADWVVISGLTIKNVGISYVEDRSAIRIIESSNCTIESNTLIDAFFGIYLEHCKNILVMNNNIKGNARHEMNSGNAIHAWYCKNITVTGNYAEGHRDGIYLEFVDDSSVEDNKVINNLRYGLHFMFSDNNRYVRNIFKENGAGVAVMFSKEILMEKNEFANNWGSSRYGLLLKEITDSEISFNIFTKNTIAIYAEGVNRVLINNNDFMRNGWALNILGSCADNTICNNNFLNNSFDVSTNSSRNYNNYNHNYWSENTGGYDLDKNGVSDVPYRPVKLFSYLIANMQSATILMRSLLVDLINHAENVAPVITPHNLLDNEPLMNRIDHDRDQGIE